MATTRTRKSVPLTEDDLDVIQRIRTEGSREALAFFELTGTSHTTSTPESETLRALIRVGLQSLAAKVIELAYECEARYMEDTEHEQWVRSRRSFHPFSDEESRAA